MTAIRRIFILASVLVAVFFILRFVSFYDAESRVSIGGINVEISTYKASIIFQVLIFENSNSVRSGLLSSDIFSAHVHKRPRPDYWSLIVPHEFFQVGVDGVSGHKFFL